MDLVTSLQQNVGFNRFILQGTIGGTTPEQCQWQPDGSAHSIAASYAHVILSEDGLIHGMMQGKPPLAATTWAGKTGVDSMPPQGSEGDADWSEWAKTVKVDLDAAAKYYEAVAAATDAYIAGVTADELDRQVDTPFGPQSINYMLSVVAGHLSQHGGEISAVKGLMGLKGYPI